MQRFAFILAVILLSLVTTVSAQGAAPREYLLKKVVQGDVAGNFLRLVNKSRSKHEQLSLKDVCDAFPQLNGNDRNCNRIYAGEVVKLPGSAWKKTPEKGFIPQFMRTISIRSVSLNIASRLTSAPKNQETQNISILRLTKETTQKLTRAANILPRNQTNTALAQTTSQPIEAAALIPIPAPETESNFTALATELSAMFFILVLILGHLFSWRKRRFRDFRLWKL